MSMNHGAKAATNGLVFAYDMGNTKKSWKGKPVENLVPAGQRTCSTSLQRLSFHIETYTYTSGIAAEGRKDVIKSQIVPLGTNNPAPYADFGFSVSRAGGSQIGDVYYISFDYKNVGGGTDPACTIAYANGYKVPDAANVGTFTDQVTVDLENGWKRRSVKCTINAAGSTWWRFGQNSGNETVEFYLDNFQVIYSNVDAPFVDGTRTSTQSFIDMTNNYTLDVVTDPAYLADGTVHFESNSKIGVTNTDFNFGPNTTWEAWFKCDSYATVYNMYMGRHLPYFSCINNGGWFVSNIIGGTQRNTTYNIPGGAQLGTWYNVIVTTEYDGTNTTTKVYVNGEFTNSSVYAGVQGNYPGVYYWGIGDGRTTNWYHFNGNVDVVKIYDRTLTAQEARQNFNALRGRFGI